MANAPKKLYELSMAQPKRPLFSEYSQEICLWLLSVYRNIFFCIRCGAPLTYFQRHFLKRNIRSFLKKREAKYFGNDYGLD